MVAFIIIYLFHGPTFVDLWSVVLSSHEDTSAWAKIYQFIFDLGIRPVHHLGDGAKALTKAGKEVFADIPKCSRLMCWSHVFRNIQAQLRSIGTHDKALAKDILTDIEYLQWSVLNEDSFHYVYNLLKQKYMDKHTPIINSAVEKFFNYMDSVWIESGESMWWEGAHPWQISNNQGLEGCNKEIKQSQKFRKRLAIGDLMRVMLRLVKEWAEKDDIFLTSSRLSVLHKDVNGLKLRTEGYQWFKQNKSGSDKIIKINPTGKYTVSEEFDLGKVDNLWSKFLR